MHFYLYDAALVDKRYASTLADVETRLTDVGLQGRIGRLGPLKSATELVRTAVKAGATTIVAVGNDATVIEVLSAIATDRSLTLGIIPVGRPHAIADLIGIPEGEDAVAVLAARRLEVMDLGKVNNYYFLTAATLECKDAVSVSIDTGFTLTPTVSGSVLTVSNLAPGGDCQDGYLEILIESIAKKGWFGSETNRSHILVERAKITGNGTIVADHGTAINLPAIIEVIPKSLKLIVGKDRVF